MLIPLTEQLISAFRTACYYEQVFGSKIQNALPTYGLDDPSHRFWLCLSECIPVGALFLNGDVLIVSALDRVEPEDVAAVVRQHPVHEIDCAWELCQKLQTLLGGDTESSYYMVYEGDPVTEEFPDIVPGQLPEVFRVLQESHEYYRSHLSYDVWAADLTCRMDQGFTQVYQLVRDGKVVGTGSIFSQDETCGVLAAIAVVPEYRHQGLGARISRFLVSQIQAMGKTPRLISGYDEVAELYKQIGFVPCGRWGELYLNKTQALC